jgi:dipeptidyl aminopeptidase/acylaminoacyl peptidase
MGHWSHTNIRDSFATVTRSLRSFACARRTYGGYSTQAALTFHPQLFAAGISICGMSDLGTFYRNTDPWTAAEAYPKYGHPVNDRELLDRLSPLLRVETLTAPLLLVPGGNDTNVPASESTQMFERSNNWVGGSSV